MSFTLNRTRTRRRTLTVTLASQAGTWTLLNFDIEVMYFDIEAWTSIYVYPYTGLTKLYFDFDIGPDIGLRYHDRSPFKLTSISKSLIHKISTSKCLDFDIEALRYWKYFDIEVNFDIEAILYWRLLQYRSWNLFSNIEVLYFDIKVSEISKVFDIEDLLYRSFHWFFRVRLVLHRVAKSECKLQPSTEVAKYRLQCKKIHCNSVSGTGSQTVPCQVGVTASKVKQRRRWRRGWRRGRRWSKNWRDSRETSFELAAVCSWFHTGQNVSLYLQDGMHSVSQWRVCSNLNFAIYAPACPLTKQRYQMAL